MVIIAFASGCADLSYNRLKLGAVPRDYDRALPAEQTRRTDLGLCYLNVSRARHRTDSIVVLWTADRRIYTKVQATYREREYGFARRGEFHLRGELLPALGAMGDAAPADMLRAIVVELTAFRGERGATEAYGWVAGGLLRILNHETNTPIEPENAGAAFDYLDRIPAGGSAMLKTAGDALLFDYRASADVK